jgi:choline dehydrogenase-like flavoprotein
LGEGVDNELRVRGLRGLRAVDATVFLRYVSENIMATSYAFAEKGADLIKADSGLF